jgi:hypothetical protein
MEVRTSAGQTNLLSLIGDDSALVLLTSPLADIPAL